MYVPRAPYRQKSCGHSHEDPVLSTSDGVNRRTTWAGMDKANMEDDTERLALARACLESSAANRGQVYGAHCNLFVGAAAASHLLYLPTPLSAHQPVSAD